MDNQIKEEKGVEWRPEELQPYQGTLTRTSYPEPHKTVIVAICKNQAGNLKKKSGEFKSVLESESETLEKARAVRKFLTIFTIKKIPWNFSIFLEEKVSTELQELTNQHHWSRNFGKWFQK